MTRRSCSWCHHMNVAGTGPVYCSGCGHRGDVPRSACDCPACRACRVPTAEEAEALARDFPQFVRRVG